VPKGSTFSIPIGFIYRDPAGWIDIGFNRKDVYDRTDTDEWVRLRENRPYININLKTILFDLDASNRIRLEYRDIEKSDNHWRFRNKLTVNFPAITKLELKPYIANDVYIRLDGTGFNKNRLYSGFSFNLAENLKADFYHLWQVRSVGNDQTDISVIGTRLKFLF